MNTLVVVSRFLSTPVSFVLTVCISNAHLLSFVEMEAVRQRVRAAVAHKKEGENRAKGKEGASSIVPKAVPKGLAKRKANGKDDRPSKKAAVTLGDADPKKKSPLKPRCSEGKRMMTSTGPVIEGHCRLLTNKDCAVEEVESFIKSTDVEPCAELGMEELGVSALFDLTRISFTFLLNFIPSLFVH